MPSFKSVLTERDVKGNIARATWYSLGADVGAVVASTQAVAAALDAISLCQEQSFTGPGQLESNIIVYGGTGHFQTCEDKAVFLFETGNGDVRRIEVPAPVDQVFFADLETVDPSFVDNATFIAAMTDGITCTREGIPLVSFLGGSRMRRPTRRRLNAYIKAADLTTPAQ